MADMDKATFHKLVAHLIRIRKAKRHIETLNDKISAIVKGELTRRGMDELETPAGDITLYEVTRRHINPEELYEQIGNDVFNHVAVRVGTLREEYGDIFVEEVGEVVDTSKRMLVKPAKKKDKLTVQLNK